MTILETRSLALSLDGHPILNGLTMDFWSGHVHAVVGPNGAGKSTFASTVMGLAGYTGFEGDIIFEGRSLRGLSVSERARLGITMAWQEPARFEGLRVDRFIRAGAPKAEDRAVEEALETVGLDPKRYFSRAVDRKLSGGERKRIELASILAMRPKLVLMDEPDSGIDVEALNRIFDAIAQLKNSGATVVLITHSMAVLERAEHAFLMCCGKLIDKGDAARIGRYFGQKCMPCDHPNEPQPGESAQ